MRGIFIILIVLLLFGCTESNENVELAKRKDKLSRNVSFTPPCIFESCLLRNYMESEHILLNPIRYKQNYDVYVNIGANLTIMGALVRQCEEWDCKSDTVLNKFNEILSINDTIDDCLKPFLNIEMFDKEHLSKLAWLTNDSLESISNAKIFNNEQLYISLIITNYKLCGFNIISEGLRWDKDIKIEDNKNVSIFFGTWLEYLSIEVSRYELNIIDDDDLIGDCRYLDYVLYFLKNHCNSSLSTLYFDELSSIYELVEDRVLGVGMNRDSLIAANKVIDKENVDLLIYRIKTLRDKYI